MSCIELSLTPYGIHIDESADRKCEKDKKAKIANSDYFPIVATVGIIADHVTDVWEALSTPAKHDVSNINEA